LKDAIAAICKDLGLKPDWSLWTAEGFPPPPGGQVEDWVAFFVQETAAAPPPIPDWIKAVAPPCSEDPARAEIRRRHWLPSHRRRPPPPPYRSPTRPAGGNAPDRPISTDNH
jgi:hypothetical protein